MAEADATKDPALEPDNAITEEDGGTTPKTFTQEELDKVVQERIKREQTKHEKAQKLAVEKAISEYERKAKLTEDERVREEFSEQESALKQREEQITLRENRSDAIELLSEAGISTKLVDFVVDLDAEATRENVKALKKVFDEAVSQAVTEKLTGKTPTDYGDGSNNTTKAKVGLERRRMTHADGSVSL